MDAKRERSVKLTKSKLDDLEPAESDRFLWDNEVHGFGVRVTPKGVKSFVLQYRPFPGGRGIPARRYTIGVFGSPLTVDTARDEAKRLLAGVAEGKDPLSIKKADREAATVAELCDAYLLSFSARYHKDRQGAGRSDR